MNHATFKDDPLPWVTDMFRRAGALASASEVQQGVFTVPEAASLLEVLSRCVSALHDDERPYVVVLNSKHASASTTMDRRVVTVGTKPVREDDTTDGQKAAIMVGLMLHEVGHIRYGRHYGAAVTRLFGADKVTNAIRLLSNIAADIHDEAKAGRAFPGLAPSLPLLQWWLGGKDKAPAFASDHLFGSHQQRAQLALSATRFPWAVIWDTPEAEAWRVWWADWAQRAAKTSIPKDHALLVKEGIEKVRETPDLPEPPGPTCGPVGPVQKGEEKPGEDGEGGNPGDDKEPGEDDDQPKGEAPGEPGDDEGEDEKPGKGEGDDGDEDGDGSGGDDGDEPGADDGSDDDGAKDGDPGEADKGGKPGEDASTGDSTDDGTENSVDPDQSCPKGKAEAAYDESLQYGVNRLTKGKREGLRERTYNHATSKYGPKGYGTGRRVTMVARKGGRSWAVKE